MSASTINLHSPPCLPLLGRNWFAKCEFTWAAFGEGEQTREYIRRVTGCVSRMGLGSAVTGQSATEKQGNINQDINPTHCAVSRGFRLFYCSRRVLKTTCLGCPRLYWSAQLGGQCSGGNHSWWLQWAHLLPGQATDSNGQKRGMTGWWWELSWMTVRKWNIVASWERHRLLGGSQWLLFSLPLDWLQD